MDIVIIIGLIVLGIILFALEVFVIPGISIAGISATISFAFAIYYAFTHFGMTVGFIALGGSALGCLIILFFVTHNKIIEKIALKKDLSGNVNSSNERNISPGDKGETVTRVALIGMAKINGNTVEVKSIDGFINEGTPILVDRIEGGRILIKKQLSNS